MASTFGSPLNRLLSWAKPKTRSFQPPPAPSPTLSSAAHSGQHGDPASQRRKPLEELPEGPNHVGGQLGENDQSFHQAGTTNGQTNQVFEDWGWSFTAMALLAMTTIDPTPQDCQTLRNLVRMKQPTPPTKTTRRHSTTVDSTSGGQLKSLHIEH